MTTTDLRPATETVYMRPADTWVFEFLFRKTEEGTPNPIFLDVSSFDFKAQLFQKVNENWVKFPSIFERKAGTPDANAIETGIYLGSADASKIVFLWDFNDSPNTEELSIGEYRLDFHYTTDNGYDKSFFSYFPILSEEIRNDSLIEILGVKYVLAQETTTKVINIYNTII